MKKILEFYRRRFIIIFLLIVLVLTCLAWHNRFIWDDPFISFRYAYNLVHGKGLVWNEGERIEGYTNFLWTLLMCIPLYLGYGPVTFSLLLGIIFFILSLVFTYKSSSLIFGSRDIGLLTIVLLGTNYTFSSFATSGMETQMQACLFVASFYVLFLCLAKNDWNNRKLLMISLLLSTALLTRLDSSLLVITIFPIAVFFIMKDKIPVPQKVGKILALLLPFTVLIGSWFIWKLSYYGDILPNTFYVKAARPDISQGLYYLALFLISYLFFPFLILLVLTLKRFLMKSNIKVIALSLVILLWAMYIVRIGGDYMEFRFIVPIMPLLFMLFVWIIFVLFQKKAMRITLILLILVGSLHHKITFGEYTGLKHMVKIDQTVRFNTNRDKTWVWGQIGRILGKSFNYSPSVTIATYAAGGIPYYSRLRTIDNSGLNDKWVARYGYIVTGFFAGHVRKAPLSYLLERKVNLIVNAWMIEPSDACPAIYSKKFLNDFFWPEPMLDIPKLPSTSKIIRIPIDQNKTLEILYLIKNPVIDEAIQKINGRCIRS